MFKKELKDVCSFLTYTQDYPREECYGKNIAVCNDSYNQYIFAHKFNCIARSQRN